MPKSERFYFFEVGFDPMSACAAALLACPLHLVDKHVYLVPFTQILLSSPWARMRATSYVAQGASDYTVPLVME